MKSRSSSACIGRVVGASTTALAQDITIGVAGPMTGGESAFRPQMKNGAEQAVADLNAAGGVLGKKLALEIATMPATPSSALGRGKVRRRKDSVRDRTLLFVLVDPGVGSLCRRQRAADYAGLDQSAVHRGKLWNVPRVCGRDDQQGLVAAQYIAKFYKGKNVAILNDKTTYGKGSRTRPRSRSNKPASRKMFESYNKGDKDFNAIVSRLNATTSTSSMSAATIRNPGCWCARCAIRVLRRS